MSTKTCLTRIPGGMIALSLAVLALSACTVPGSSTASGGDDSSVPAAVVQTLEDHSGPVTPAYAAPPFDASSAAGKTVWWVPQSTANPFLSILGQNFVAALESQGVTVMTCDGKNNPVDGNNCIDQAIAQGGAAIQVDGPEATTYTAQLEAARKAGIPVFSGAAVDAANPLVQGLTGQTSQAFRLSGTLLADWVARDSAASAHVLFLTTPDVAGSVEEEKAFSQELASVCPHCASVVKGVTLANWATDIAPVVNAELLRDHDIDYVVPAFDPMTQFAAPAIQQAGRAGTVQIATVNGSLQQMQQLRQGQLIGVEVGVDLNALGYLEADQVLRSLAGAEPLTTFPVGPVRIFDRSNAGDLDLTADKQASGAWYTEKPGAYSEFFARLWRGGR